MTTVREINDIASLSQLRGDWAGLLAQTPGASFFQSLEWLQTYWRHFGAGQRLRVLVVGDGRHSSGIVPLVVRPSRRKLATLQVLTYPLDDWGSFYGPIGPDPAGTLEAALRHVRRTPRDWHLIELAWADASGSEPCPTGRAFARTGFDVHCERRQATAVVDLTSQGSWQAYWAARPSHWRNNVRRNEKRLASAGRLTYLRHRSPAGAAVDPRWDLYEACEEVATASWQARSQDGTTLAHESVRSFFRDSHRTAALAGTVDLNLLFVDRRPVAFNYAYQYRGNIFGLRTGYDPSAAGAGSVLQARMIADSFARGDRTYDLGPGYLDCKRYWLTQLRWNHRYTHYPAEVPLAQLVRAGRQVSRLLHGSRPWPAAHK